MSLEATLAEVQKDSPWSEIRVKEERISDCSSYQTIESQVVGPYSAVDFVIRQPFEQEFGNKAVFLCPGFTDGKDGLRRLARMMTKRGVTTVSIDHPRFFHPEYKDDQEAHKADNILLAATAARELLERNIVFDMVGHSEGGANTSRFALEHPDMVENIVVMASGGLIENDNVEKIFFRAARHPEHLIRHIRHFMSHPNYDLRILGNTGKYVLKQPLKARQEAAQIATADIRGRFADLRNLGIRSGALQFPVDELFPLDKVQESVCNDEMPSGTIFDIFSVYPYEDAGHLTPQLHPDTTAGILLAMTTELKKLAA